MGKRVSSDEMQIILKFCRNPMMCTEPKNLPRQDAFQIQTSSFFRHAC